MGGKREPLASFQPDPDGPEYKINFRSDGRSPFLHLFFNDPIANRQVPVSLKTRNLDIAKTKAQDWVLKHAGIGRHPPQSITIALCVERYLARRELALKAEGLSAKQIARRLERSRIAQRQINAYWKHSPVSAITRETEDAFFRHFIETGRSPQTAARVINVLSAALNDCVGIDLDHAPKLRHTFVASPKFKTIPSLEELRAVYAAADVDYLRIFILLSVYTAGRKGAVLDLARAQCDLRRMRIDLLPPGASQVRGKYRPILPLSPMLLPIIERSPGFLIHNAGKRLADVRSAWDRARERAGLGRQVQRKFIRHFTKTAMKNPPYRVDQEQRDLWCGHQRPDTAARRYEVDEESDEYLIDAMRAAEALTSEVARTDEIRATSEVLTESAIHLRYTASNPQLGRPVETLENSTLRCVSGES